MNDLPLVSIIIPTFNSRKTVFEAVKSVYSQTYGSFEVIVVNDNAVDYVGSDLKKSYPNLIYFHDGVNRGGGGARNKGVGLANGEFIGFLDDDDTYLNDKLAVLIEQSQKHPFYDAYFGALLKVNDDYRYGYKINRLTELKDIGRLHTITSIIRKEVFNEIQFYEKLRKYQDTQLHIELISLKNILYYDYPVAVWNVAEREDRITRMAGYKDYIKSCTAYYSMIQYLRRKKINGRIILALYALMIKHCVGALVKLCINKVRGMLCIK